MKREGDIAASAEDKDTKQAILDATVELIREEGFSCATLRRIASKANINLALVNYHYGSKENLLGDAARMLVSTFDEAFSAIEDEGVEPRERLKMFFIRYIYKLQQYPGLARQMFDQTPKIMGSQDKYVRYRKMMKMQKIINAVREITQEPDEDKIMTMIMQLYGAVVLPAFMLHVMPKDEEDGGPQFKLPSIEEQVDELFDRYFYKYQ